MEHPVLTLHGRRSVRMRGYDYGQTGAYFVTVCAAGRECLFGEVVGDEMHSSKAGEIVAEEWLRCAFLRPRVTLDAFVVMPNHLHGILVLDDEGRGTVHRAPTSEAFGKPTSDTVPTIVRYFKAATTRRINLWRGTPAAGVWQRGYYEHVVSDEASLSRLREYIQSNLLRWALDRENPELQARSSSERGSRGPRKGRLR